MPKGQPNRSHAKLVSAGICSLRILQQGKCWIMRTQIIFPVLLLPFSFSGGEYFNLLGSDASVYLFFWAQLHEAGNTMLKFTRKFPLTVMEQKCTQFLMLGSRFLKSFLSCSRLNSSFYPFPAVSWSALYQAFPHLASQASHLLYSLPQLTTAHLAVPKLTPDP